MAKTPLTNGFQRKQYNEIKSGIEKSLIASLGAVNLMSPSIFASIVKIFAEREADIWQQVEAVYNASYPETAEGYSLDGVCALNGVIREIDTYSQSLCQLTAVNYTKIPKHSEIAVKHTSNIFALTEDITVNNERCCNITLQVNNAFKKSYELFINQEKFEYTKIDEDTEESIATALISIINDANIGISAIADNDSLILSSTDYLIEFSCFVSDGLKILDCTNNAQVIATRKGSITASIGSLTDIHTPVSGWIASNNLDAAKIGNDLESDRSLKARRKDSIKLGGSGTLEAIKANLLNLTGVTAVSIRDNINETSGQNIPLNSFTALVTGGEDSEIARVLWQKKPAGIRPYGVLQVSTTDSAGNTQIVGFSRPIKCFVHAKVVITKTVHFNEDCLPSMKVRLIEQINSLGVGNNLILKSLFLSIFQEQGISNAVITLGGTVRTLHTPKLKEADIEIKASEVTFTDSARIEIILEDFK